MSLGTLVTLDFESLGPGNFLTYFNRGLRVSRLYRPVPLIPVQYPLTRDGLYDKLKSNGIFGRRYFYPLISDFPMYRTLRSSSRENLPVAHSVAKRVICLPIYPALDDTSVDRIIDIIAET